MSVIDLEGNMTHFEIQFPLWFTICLLLVLSAALTFAQAPDKVLLSLAESGDVQSMMKVADAYLESYSLKEADKWYRRAADSGDSAARFTLGMLLSVMPDLALHDDESVQWIQKAAEQGHVKAQVALGTLYLGADGRDQDYIEAVKWLKMAAAKGEADAQYTLAYLYHQGLGTKQDYSRAAQWYIKAARQGNAEAQLKLGYLYSEGLGIKQSDKHAAYWYHKAALQDNALAQYAMGMCCTLGFGTAQNMTTAYRWCSLSADNGWAAAAEQMKFLASNMTQDETSAAQRAHDKYPKLEPLRKAATTTQPGQVTTIKGETYSNAVVVCVEPDGISYKHSGGIAKLSFNELPAAVRKEYNYSPKGAAVYRKKIQQAEAAWIRQQQAAIEKQKYDNANITFDGPTVILRARLMGVISGSGSFSDNEPYSSKTASPYSGYGIAAYDTVQKHEANNDGYSASRLLSNNHDDEYSISYSAGSTMSEPLSQHVSYEQRRDDFTRKEHEWDVSNLQQDADRLSSSYGYSRSQDIEDIADRASSLGLGHRTSSAFRDAAKAQESAVYNNNGNPQPSYNQWQNNADQKYREANRMLQGEW